MAVEITSEQFDEMQEQLYGEEGNEIHAAMLRNATQLNQILRPMYSELVRRSERKLARKIIRAMFDDIEEQVMLGINSAQVEAD
jgi:hypothetical protein